MADFWLVPVESVDLLVLGADRLKLEAGSWENFREKLSARFPAKLLPMVKARILPADPGEEACGSGETPDLAVPGPVVFDGHPYGLSDCGRAFIDRLPALKDQTAAFRSALSMPGGEWSTAERDMLVRLNRWSESGWITMLVKED